MKIGIMTFWWSEDNYGQLLQCYALQKYLRDQGHDPYLIRYDPRNDYIKSPFRLRLVRACNPVLLFNFLKQKRRFYLASKEQIHNNRGFELFRKIYIAQSETLYTSYKQLQEDPPQADMYIVGSDQVWNFNRQKLRNVINLLHAYFLDFGPSTVKRVSYAASWSVTKLKNEIAQEIKPLLKKFSYVSVREKEGIELCRSLGVDAEWVCDPTLLLMPGVYRSEFTEKNFTKKCKPYLFLYLLGNECDCSIKDILFWAQNKNLDIVYITGNANIDKYDKIYATIPEWLFLLDNAEYVITNSFHCCVFSSLFSKQFAAVPTKGAIKGMNTRLESLWELLKIEKRYLIDGNFTVLDKKYKTDNSKINTIFLKHLIVQIKGK